MKKILILPVVVGVAGYWFLGRGGAPGADVMELDPEKVILSGTAPLNAVGDYSGSGTATRQWDGKMFVHRVSANLDAPADGKFYEGWLVQPSPFEFISTGRLERDGRGYRLDFSATRDLSGFTGVVITEETESLGLDGNPEAHVLEGSF